jgi:glyoxylase-like metal-dependent hydrolase (beta-lactamase superfamily II)/rhodanese-related sulfurtransferase
VILEQLYLGCLSQASYLVGDEEAGVAAVVDPRRDVDVYLEEAERRGLEIQHVFLTHFHADFVSGHLELASRTGAKIHVGAAVAPEFEAHGIADGESVRLGQVEIRALATPGHTPESTCFVVYDHAASSEEPHGVFTGDTLFIGDVGRPDLLASVGVTQDELARKLYNSLRDKLLPLPDATVVYPGHGAGSACGKNLSTETTSTMGTQRELNYALQPMSEDEFVGLVTEGQPPAPAYFAYDATMNKKQHPTLDEVLEKALTPLQASDLERLVSEEEAQVLDTRSADYFATSHRPGSLNVGIDGRFAGWAGAVLDPEKPVVIIADAGREEEVAVRLGRVGIDSVVGFLDGGAFSLEGELEHFERVSPRDLATCLEGEDPPLVLDVRGPGEVASAHLEGSLSIPLPELPKRVAEVPQDRDVVVMCAGGYRSTIAASLLRREGHERISDLRGGMGAWQAAGLPIQGQGCSA